MKPVRTTVVQIGKTYIPLAFQFLFLSSLFLVVDDRFRILLHKKV